MRERPQEHRCPSCGHRSRWPVVRCGACGWSATAAHLSAGCALVEIACGLALGSLLGAAALYGFGFIG